MNDFCNIQTTDFFNESNIAELKNQSTKLIKDKKIYRKFLDQQYKRVSSIAELLGKLPEKNEQIRLITQKSFNAFAILLYIAENVNIKELILCSYSMDKNSAEGIKELFEQRNIEKITIILSSFFNQTKKPERFSQILLKFAKKHDNVKLIFCWNHTKIMAIKTTDSRYFVIEGSGNLSNNARVEQYLFEQSQGMYEFHKSWVDEIVELSGKSEVEIF